MDTNDPAMKPEPSREEVLFQTALDLDGPARPAFLEQACAGDPVLRQRLEALLAAHAAADDVLGVAAERTLPTVTLDLADERSPAAAVGQ